MSLFPAYFSGNTIHNETSNKDKKWLVNSSFNVGTSTLTKAKEADETGAKSDQNIRRKNKNSRKRLKAKKWYERKRELFQEKKLSKKYRKAHPNVELISDDCGLYCTDRTKRMEYLVCSTLTHPIKPKYRVYRKNLIGPKYEEPKERKGRRYYSYKCLQMKESEQEELDASDESKAYKRAEKFNKTLCETSRVADWIAFVEFQDEFFRSQRIAYRTECDREKAIKKRKMDILERAMHYNPQNEELLNFWMKVGTDILSPEKMSKHLQKMLEYSPGRLSLWLNLISVRQLSLALCSFSSVTELYKKAIDCLKGIKTDFSTDRDSDVIELLFNYCKFLQDCGHWEILWTIVKNNIKLNFGLDISVDLDIEDRRVKQLEDEIICVDKQPIWVTWGKVEALREGLHFLPVAETLDYPQRCVSLNEMFEFIVHFHRDMHFKLIVKFIMLLKVPYLPFNSTVLKIFFNNGSIWTLDSPEIILSAAFSAPSASVKTNYLKFVPQVSKGPQYLRNVEGQQEFLEFVQKTFQECVGILEGKQKVILGLWWLRFNRWLCILDRHSLATLQLPAKKMKNLFKEFMKNSQNRDNLLYYCEYSLFEYDQGNVEASVKTLKTLISARPSVFQLTDELEKAALCMVYRRLCELYLEIGQKDDAVNTLINLAIGSSPDVKTNSNKLAVDKFEAMISDLVRQIRDRSDSVEGMLVPDFSLEWIHCYLWLIALSESTATAHGLYLRLNSILSRNSNLFSYHAREYLCEAMAVILWTTDKSSVSPLTCIIKDGLMQFPYNLKIMSLLASQKLEEHSLWWTFKQSFLNPPTIIGCVILTCVALARKEIDKESFGNRLKSLFRQLALSDGKFSSVLHSLRLMFLFDFDHSQLDSAQLNAVESCPWKKSLYTCAISVLPNKLMELTDIMIEKELRIHITPDEIQEMRD